MKRDYIVKQNDYRDCGICCLASIIKYYKGNIPLETLRLDTKTNRYGTTAFNLINAAKKYGFEAYGKRITVLDNEIILPAIAHLEYSNGLNHFVVIYKIDNNYVYTMNPSKGYEKKEIKEFKKIWTNVILIFKPYRVLPFHKNNNSLLNLIINITKKEKNLILKILLLNLLITFISIILGYFFQIASYIAEQQTIVKMIITLTMFLFLTICKLYASYIHGDIAIHLNKNIDLTMITSFISHIFHLPLNVIKGRTPGEIITRIRELFSIKELFSEIIITIFLDITMSLSSLYFLFIINKTMTLMICIITFIYIVVAIVISPYLVRYINDNIDLETEFNSTLVEMTDSIESIKNLNILDKTINQLDEKYCNYLTNTLLYSKFINIISLLKNNIKEIGLFLILSYGFILIQNESLSISLLITYNSILSIFISPLDNILNLIPKFEQIKLSLTKANEFLNVSPEKEGNIETFINGDIYMKNITYSYDDYNNVISNRNILIHQNEHFIMKGHSGCGKSTLCKMLNRSIDNYQGNIYINGYDIKNYSLKTIRNYIVYVSQRENLFTDTIKNNIVLDQDITIEELQQIINITKINEILEHKSFKLDSMLYDSGYNLSGGERQRIVLARALIRKPKILILDEALNQVDYETEKYIIENLDAYLKYTTLIYVSHSNNDFLSKKLELKSE